MVVDSSGGFNIADNYSSNSAFNNMIGFNEHEVRALIDYYKSQTELPHTTGIIADSFPAEDIVKLENFKSLLYYYGMLTISATRGPLHILSIPNKSIREQLHNWKGISTRL